MTNATMLDCQPDSTHTPNDITQNTHNTTPHNENTPIPLTNEPQDNKKPSRHRRSCSFPFSLKNLSWQCALKFFLDNFLVLGLLFAIFFSLVCPWPGAAVNSVHIGSWAVFSTINIITIFLISGLTLKTKEIKETIKQWFSFIVGVITILFITPCAAFVMMALPFQPPSSSYGLAIFALTPTTVASGIVLVTQAKGNPVLALSLTVVTNILAVFILPYSIQLTIPAAGNIGLDPASLMVKLILTILVPLLIGKALRELFGFVQRFVDNHKRMLSLINNGSLICIVWQTMSAGQKEIVSTSFGTICLVLLTGILLHIAYLIVNFILITICRLPTKEGIAVLVMGSEKTLPMAVTVIAFLPSSMGTKGQLTMPCVFAHISQVLIDAFLCGRLGKRKEKKEEDNVDESDDGGSDGDVKKKIDSDDDNGSSNSSGDADNTIGVDVVVVVDDIKK